MEPLKVRPGNGQAEPPRTKTLAVALAIGGLAYAGLAVWRSAPYLRPVPVQELSDSLDGHQEAERRRGGPSETRGVRPAPYVPSAQPPGRPNRVDATSRGGPPGDVTRWRARALEEWPDPASGIRDPAPPAAEGQPDARPERRIPLEVEPTRAGRVSAPDPEATPSPGPDPARESDGTLLRLAGRVIDEGGNAAPGLTVLARPWRLFAGSNDARGSVAAAERRSVTGTDGSFVFQQLPDGEYQLETEDTELYGKATALVRAGVDSAVLAVETKPGRSRYVSGIVESTRGGPVSGARVDVVGQPRLTALSDESGTYSLRLPLTGRPPNTVLRFSRDGFRERILSIGAPEAVESDRLERNVRLVPLGQSASVTGSVTGDDGAPVRRASVQLFSTGRRRSFQAFSDDDGRFSLADVEPADDYRLWIRAQGQYKDHVQEGVRVAPEGASLDVVLESLGGASLQGLMLDPEGRPLPGFTLWIRAAHGPSAKSVTGDAVGGFAVGDLPEGPVTLETRALPLLTVTGIQMTRGAVQEARLTLDIGDHRLEGHLHTHEGLPVAGARVTLHWSFVEGGLKSQSFRESVSDASGYFLFTQLAAGVHTLNVTATGFRNKSLRQQVGFDTPAIEVQLQPSP
jgi:hypothetical protein